MSTSDGPTQSPQNAWVNRVRDEALRMRHPAVSKCFTVGMVIATYTDEDGSNAWPSLETISAIAGCSDETVTRCVKLLVAVGLLARKRRPNTSALYQLLIPLERPNWEEHLHLYTKTRQARAKREKKAREIAEMLAARTPTQDGSRKPFPTEVPGTVPAGCSEPPGDRRRTVPDTDAGRVPETVPAGGDQPNHLYEADQPPDHAPPGAVPQPQVVAASAVADFSPEGKAAGPALHTVPTSPGSRGRDTSGGQQPLLLAVRIPPHVDEDTAQLRATATPEIIRRAITELGQGEAIARYGWRLVNPHIAQEGEARAAQ
ncbi:helix-turn-helix domain-containing protein [Streptomyces sp. NPDC051320]|uniref:helix-turn-helix domain-containing protein n=1 Tax=Streptomyces sp. NPDC051320 TaxID=3154644 RepID=UPI00342F4618